MNRDDYLACQRAILAHHSKLLIFAGTTAQALNWARHAVGLPYQDFLYVHDGYLVRGRRGAPYVIVGTFWDRRDVTELRDLMQLMALEHVETKTAYTWTEQVLPMPKPTRDPGYAPGEVWFE